MGSLDHLPEGGESDEKLGEPNGHMDDAERIKQEACSKAKAKMAELEIMISSIVGLEDLKSQLRRWGRGLVVDEKRRAIGSSVAPRKPPHMVFLGNPGTGKTMVARILGKLMQMVGILPLSRVTEVQRTDLVGKYIGHTGARTKKKITEAEGGILFVDEAYRLVPTKYTPDDKDFGKEAIEEIMSVMDNGKIMVIFAGYPEPMKRVFESNEGLRRRVTKSFKFEDYNTTQLAQILHIKMNEQDEYSVLSGFKLHPSCTAEAIAELIEKETTEEQRKAMNGGMIEPLLINARENLDYRLDFDCTDIDSLMTITMDDLKAGIKLLSP